MATTAYPEDGPPAQGAVKMSPPEFVATSGAWDHCLERLRAEPRIAIDVESNSLYAYRETVCLIQFSIPGHDYILDPLAGFPVQSLGDILANPAVEKVLHASEYDLILFKRVYGWDVCNLFDTMWAARILGFQRMGLAVFLHDFFGVVQSKKHQKANWAKRPLSPDQIKYAQADTHYLLPLRDQFEDMLRDAGKLEEAREIFASAARVRVPDRAFEPEDFRRLRGARDLAPREQAVLRELFVMREDEAMRRDLPPFKVLNNEALVALAIAQPTQPEEVDRTHGVSVRTRDRLGRQIAEAVRRGLQAPLPQRPKRGPRREQAVADRYERLQEWRKAHARARGVESDVILTRDAMWAIAEDNPRTMDDLADINALGPRRLSMYGEEILDQLG